MKWIFVTGGAGYIGSHTCLELLNNGYEVVVGDNFSNSKALSLQRVKTLAQRPLLHYRVDIRDASALRAIFSAHPIDAVIHFAGLKAVGESVAAPLRYHDNNVTGTITLCKIMHEYGVKNLVFSSSATVYGKPRTVPITEGFPTSATNPYGRSKLIIEEILRDLHGAEPAWNIALLRYFNPAGAHQSGMIGEDPNGTPNNLMPYVSQVASGKLQKLSVYGGDYPTVDGTGIRDYIHVVDLAGGHLAALEKLRSAPGMVTYNLGTGVGYSVREVVKAFERVSGRHIPYEIVGRRSGDVAECYADPSLARRELGWTARRGIEEMCADAWRWQRMNPDGYAA